MLVVLWFKSSLPVREVTPHNLLDGGQFRFKSSLPVREVTAGNGGYTLGSSV